MEKKVEFRQGKLRVLEV